MKLFRTLALSTSIASALSLSSPVVAQDADGMSGETDRAMQAMSEIFKAEPLTPEQEARLPVAEDVVMKIFPPGTYMKMMDGTLKPMMDGITASMGTMPMADLMRLTGLPQEKLNDMGDATLEEVMAILDPAYQERQSAAITAMSEWMVGFMDEVEPSFRAGLTRAYAARFEQFELDDLNAFFQTPTGARYAGESMLIMMDPQVMSAMGEMMPMMMERMPEMTGAMQSAMESLPPARSIDELSDEERAKLEDLLGISE